MKNYFLAFVLAVLVVLTAVSLRRSVVGIGGDPVPTGYASAIGGDPVPTINAAALRVR